MMNRKINEFNSLYDMTTFPWSIHLGASLNIVFSIWLTHIVFNYVLGNILFLIPFSVFLITLNILPVIILRKMDNDIRPFPSANEMSFFKDQHRFATWVYAIASGNMFFWITFSWSIFSLNNTNLFLIITQIFAFLITYPPLWRKKLNKVVTCN